MHTEDEDMSPEVVLVLHHAGRSYVVKDATHTQWTDPEFAKTYVELPNVKWTRVRANALVMAHNIDNATPSLHGVREIFVPKANRKRVREEDEFD